MPIYAYRCSECGAAHEALQKLSAQPLIECPACGKPALVKQVTAAGFQLKGSGWYVTDFRGGGQAKDEAKSHDEAKGKDAAGDNNEGKSKDTAKSKDESKRPPVRESEAGRRGAIERV
jgi:putative FmdB family regulatory protein